MGHDYRSDRLLLEGLSAFIEQFLPSRLHDGDMGELRRARLAIGSAWALILVAAVYLPILYWMNTPIGAAVVAVAIGLAIVSIGIVRYAGSSFAAGNLLSTGLFATLTIMAYRLDGHSSQMMPWYVVVPILALNTSGRPSAVFWLLITAASQVGFYTLHCCGHQFPNDLNPQHYELLRLLSWIGLCVLMLGFALLYETAVRQTLAGLKLAEDSLIEEKRFSDLAIASLPGVFYLLDGQGRLVRWNENTERISGHSPDEMLKMRSHEFFCEEDWGLVAKSRERVHDTGHDTSEARFLTAGETAIPYLFSSKRVEIGGESHVIGAGIDISERKRLEEERTQLLHDMNERIKEQTCMHEVSRSILQRETLEEIFCDVASLIPVGWHYGENARGKIVFEGREFVSEAFEETEWKQISEITVDGKTCGRVEVYCLQEYPVADEGPFLKEERDLIDAIAHTLGGAVARKRAEQKMQDYAAALERSNVELEELNRAVVAANQAKTEFLANMSHEIRTPMTAILGFTELLLGEECTPYTCQERANSLVTIKRNGEYLLQLINDILDLSKIEAGGLDIERITCSPTNVVGDVESLMCVRANAKGLSLEIEYASAIPESIVCDPTRLRQILINLVGNAIKFTETGSVRLVTRFVQDGARTVRLQFDVIDTGIGMTEEQTCRIFLPFAQADASTTREFGGTGLGLAISQRLAGLLGGHITVRSVPERGSTFCLSIPSCPTDDVLMPEEAAKAVAAGRQDTEQIDLSDAMLDCCILLAEDGPDNQRLISFLLKKAGANVTLAENGQIAAEKALAALEAGTPFDVILMDMQMPVMDGYTATRKLREAGYAAPILALTANAMAGDRAKCCSAGCDGYATKPIERAKLFSTIVRFLDPARQTTADRSAGSGI